MYNMNSEILDFYQGANVLVTGGTGFLGKILIEKLLRSTSVSTIYMFLRPKKGKSVTERFDEIFGNVVFSKLKTECPKFLDRIVEIKGDFCESRLGMSEHDKKMLISNVNIIFNVAACVRFEEHINLAYKTHVVGTEEILKLCKEMKQLKAFLHVSTAFSNCFRKHVEEKLYDYNDNYTTVGHFLDETKEVIDEKFTKRIIGQWPNTYTFTKALGESVIKHTSKGIPTGVFRPSIVLSTFKEPMPGWTDNMNGPTGLIVATNLGLVRTIYLDGSKVSDVVPVDMCVSCMIVAAWDVGRKNIESISNDIAVYNYVSGPENPITWREFCTITDSHAVRYPPGKMLWAPLFNITYSYKWHLFLRLIYHIIPALLVDTVTILIGNRLRLLPIYKRYHNSCDIYFYFTKQEWTYSNDNVVKLWHHMNTYEKELFPFGMAEMNWLTYFKTYYTGLREHLMKESIDNVEAARRRHWMLIILHNMLMGSLYFGMSVLLWTFVHKLF